MNLHVHAFSHTQTVNAGQLDSSHGRSKLLKVSNREQNDNV